MREGTGASRELSESFAVTSQVPIAPLSRTQLVQSSAILGVNTLAAGALGFLFWTIAARALPAAEVGRASAYTAALGLAVALAAFGLPEALIRYLPHTRAPRTLARRAAGITSITGLLCGVGFLLTPASSAIPLPAGLPIATGLVVSLLANGLTNAILLAYRSPASILAGSILTGVTKCASLILAMNAETAIAAFGIGTLAGLGLTTFMAMRAVPSEQAGVATPTAIQWFALGNWVSNIASLLPMSLAPSLLLVRGGAEMAAYGAMPLLFLSLLNLPSSVVARTMFAEASRHPSRLNALAWRAAILALTGTFVISVGTLLFAELVLNLFGRAYAQEGAQLLRLLAVASLIAVPNYFIDTVLNVRRDVSGYVIVNVGGSVAIGALLLASVSDLLSLGFAWLIGQAVYLLIACLVLALRRGRANE